MVDNETDLRTAFFEWMCPFARFISYAIDHQPVACHFELRLDDGTNRYISGRFESILTSGLRNSDDTRFA